MTRGFLLGSIGFSLVLLAACGASDSDEGTFTGPPTGRGGSSGKGGSGGKAGSGASAGTSASGSGGSAGKGGGAGKAGSGGATGGAAGKAGSTSGGGSSGAAGASGANAGAGGGPAMCSTGRGDCNESAADGCETDLTNSKDHCGACDAACPGVPSANVTCQSGKCVNTCFLGTGDCDGDTKNGCETNTNEDPKNCGTCGAPACADGPNGVASCEGGSCAFACNAGFGDCNDQPGCETAVTTDPLNCGACGINCGQGASCKNGACECAASTSVAELLPVDLHLLLDSSGSMAAPVECKDVEKCNFFFCWTVQECSSKTRWSETTAALKSFIGSATAADKIGMGLTFFPNPSGTCNASSYQTPVVVAADLPGAAPILTSTINAKQPNGGTPTQPAVQGALNQAIAFQAAHPDRKSVLLLATDGRPEGCNNNTIQSVGAAIADAKAKGIPTYVIGIFTAGNAGDEAELKPGLNAWAAQGGSTKAYFPAVGDNLAVEFKNALDDIRKTAIGCEYAVPKPTGGQPFDPNKVNVSYVPGTGAEQPLVNVADAAACKPGAWHYDNPAAPTKILLCPAVCDTVKADAAAKVNVSVGCGTRKD